MSCRLSEHSIAGMRAFYLENDLLKVGILADRGSDIFEFRYKPKNIDFLLRLSKGIRNPQTHFSQIRNTKNQFEDYYYGGWQVCLPNSAPFNYRGAELGQHGEVSLIPWTIETIKTEHNIVSITLSTSPLRLPLKIERTLTLRSNSGSLEISERVLNVGKTELSIMWGQHIAFGLPFIDDEIVIDTNAKTMDTEFSIPEHHRFKRGETFQWPDARNKNDEPDDAQIVNLKKTGTYSDMCFLEGYPRKAFYAIKNKKKNVGFSLTWNGEVFKVLWLWTELGATKDFPWWGDCYTVALEPWTSRWTGHPQQAIDNKEWLTLNAGETIETSFTATAFEDNVNPERL